MIVKNNEKLKSREEREYFSGRFVRRCENGKQIPNNKLGDLFQWGIVGTEKFPVLAWLKDFHK